jgi:hypothetical protein
MTSPICIPREIEVAADDCGEPVAVVLDSGPKRVARVRNVWRIDDEWWRQEISRLYFEVELDDGHILTMFHDLVSRKWYRQRY